MNLRLLAITALVALMALSGVVVAAQDAPTTVTAESPFQTVRVDGFSYSVDPFFPCVAFITERTTRLDSDAGVASTITLQLFIRADDQMTAIEPFTTTENDLTATAEVGQAFTCAPQEAVDSEDLDG